MPNNGQQKEAYELRSAEYRNVENPEVTYRESRGSCLIKWPICVLLVLLALTVAVAVGLTIYFIGPRHSPCVTGITVPPTTLRPTKAPLPDDVRLPTTFQPLHYSVELFPDIYQENPEDFQFSGTVEILIECIEPATELILHINKLNVDQESVQFIDSDDESRGPNKEGDYKEDELRQFWKQSLGGPTVAGRNYTLKMSFTGNLTRGLAGLYYSHYTEGNQSRYIATTQFQPTDARRAFPCFDEPGIKSTFDITLVRRPPMISLSNMPIKRTETRPNGDVADIYERTVKMPTYLLAFIICDFDKKEGVTKNGTKFRVWARREAVNQTLYSLDVGIKIITYFENYFDIPFPLPKQDMIAIPDFAAGAMENWGLITYRETALLYDEEGSSASNKQRVCVVVSHELAHQWFGNLVTPAWWDDLWLNEGFASYVEYLGVDHVHPELKMMEQFVTEDLQDVMKYDGLASSHPIYVPVKHPNEINEIFDRISYAKGASVIRMMNSFLGESTFRQGLTNYLRSHQFGNTHHTDLWKALTEQAHADGKDINVGDIMNTWVRQMGYPVVAINRHGTSADVTQNHFLMDPSQQPSSKYPTDYGYKWQIQLTYTTQSKSEWNNPTFEWMKGTDSIGLTGLPSNSSEWLIGNVRQTGYYRVDYDKLNWQALIQQLMHDHLAIHPNNRAQIIDDAFSLAKAGVYNVDQIEAMESTRYLVNERDYVPWDAAIVNLNYVNSMLGSTSAYGKFKKYMLKQVQPLYDTMGWDESRTDPPLDQYLRSMAIARACANGHKDCLGQCSRLFKQWMANPSVNPIRPNIKGIVYCNAIRNGGVDEWDFAYERGRVENLGAEKSRLLAAMACTKEPWILSRYLTWSLDEKYIRKQDAVFTIVYIAGNPIGMPLAWDFVRANWDYVFDKYGVGFFSFTRLIGGITSTFNTDFQLQQIINFMEAKKYNNRLGSGERALEQAIEKTNKNIKWMKDNYDRLDDWLTDFLGGSVMR